MLLRATVAFVIAVNLSSVVKAADLQQPLTTDPSRLNAARAMLKARWPSSQASQLWLLVLMYGPHVPSSEKDSLAAEFRANLATASRDCEDALAPIYASRFSETELRQQTEFFASPLLATLAGNDQPGDGKTIVQRIVNSWMTANPKDAFQRAVDDVQGQPSASKVLSVVDARTKRALRLIKLTSPPDSEADLTELGWNISEQSLTTNNSEMKGAIHAAFVREMGIELENNRIQAARKLAAQYNDTQLDTLIQLASAPGFQKYLGETQSISAEARQQLIKCDNDAQGAFEGAISKMKDLEARH